MGVIRVSWKLRFSKVIRLVMRLNHNVESGLGVGERNSFPPPSLSLSLSFFNSKTWRETANEGTNKEPNG